MSSLINQATIKIRQDTAGNWTSNNPTPAAGEWCLETDTGFIKKGDGSTAWNDLSYQGWNKITNPSVGWLANKVDAWTTDDFSNGLEVDFSDAVSSTGVPLGAKAVRVVIAQFTSAGSIYYRKSGDSNITNTPDASTEYSHNLMNQISLGQYVLWLSSDYKVQFTTTSATTDLYIAYPIEYLF